MPESSVILSQRKTPRIKNKPLLLFAMVIVVVSIIGFFSYQVILDNFANSLPVLDKQKTQLSPKDTPDQNLITNQVVKTPEQNAPNNVFLGLNNILSTTFSDVAKQEINPLTGGIVSSDKKQNLKIRPWAIMVDNNPISRPQVGIGDADVVYEGVKELGVTSLLVIYYEQRPPEVGPVDELRYYFAALSAEYAPFLVHNGGPEKTENEPSLSTDPSVDIYTFIGRNGLYSIDRSKGASEVFTRVVNDSNEQYFLDTGNYYSYLGKIFGSYLWVDSDKFTSWKYKEDETVDKRIDELTFNFWDLTDYEVTWKYNPGQNNYIRTQGGVVFQDSISRRQVTAKNVILQFVEEDRTGDLESNLKYNVVGSGDVMIYLDGTKVLGKWKKLDVNSRTIFESELGNEIRLNSGNTWIELLPNESMLKIKEQSGI